MLGSNYDRAEQKRRLGELFNKAGPAMDALQKMGDSVDKFVNKPELQRGLPDTLTNMNNTFRNMNDAIDEARSQLQDLKKFTNTLRDKGPDAVVHLDQAAEGMDVLTQKLNTFADALNDDKGSLGQLVHKPDLYENLNRAVGNIKELTVQLQPVIHDARVFSDKIARHPETLGVRGAISPSLGTKGLPSLPPLGGSSGWSDDPSQTPPPNGQPWRYNR